MELYLDNAATTRVNEKVIDRISKLLKEEYGNPSSIHKRGLRSSNILKESREEVAKSLNVTGDEIIFNSCATEGNNQVIKSFSGKKIVSDQGEHPSVRNTLLRLKEEGAEVNLVPIKTDGHLDMEALENAIEKDTALVSIMMVNNETGIINPIKEISEIIKKKGSRAKFHVDIVQGYLKFPIDLKELNIDYATISFHKVHGPKGIGALYIKKGLKPLPLLDGGSQEMRLRAGTHNVPYIGGIREIPEIYGKLIKENYDKAMTFRNKIIDGLKEEEGFKLNGSNNNFSPYILNISLKGCPSQVMLNLLSEKGLYVSTGSACSQKNMKDSHVLTAMGLNKEELSSSLRISFSDDTKEEDIDKALVIIKNAIKFFKKIK